MWALAAPLMARPLWLPSRRRCWLTAKLALSCALSKLALYTSLLCFSLPQEQQRVVSQGAKGISELGAGDAAAAGAEAVGAAISPQQLKHMLTYPPDWGPTEWVRTCCRQAVSSSTATCTSKLSWGTGSNAHMSNP
jgi:hypothetical protein